MSWWVLLLGFGVVVLGVLWSTRLPPSISVDLPDPPKVEDVPVAPPIVERLFGLWSTPESHFWSDNLRVGPPAVARDEYIPHGPRVAEQSGWTRPYIGSKMRSSEWTEEVRRALVASGVPNPLDKSFSTSGVLERAICSVFCATKVTPVSPEPPIYDGGGPDATSTIVLDAGNQTTDSNIVLTGGNQNGGLA